MTDLPKICADPSARIRETIGRGCTVLLWGRRETPEKLVYLYDWGSGQRDILIIRADAAAAFFRVDLTVAQSWERPDTVLDQLVGSPEDATSAFLDAPPPGNDKQEPADPLCRLPERREDIRKLLSHTGTGAGCRLRLEETLFD